MRETRTSIRTVVLFGLGVSSLALSGLALAVGCGSSGSTNGAAVGAGGNDGGLASFVDDAGFSGVWEDGSFVATSADGGFCSGSGPIVVVGDSDGGTVTSQCTGQIAEEIFKSALCTCQDVNLQGYLRTRGFSSASAGADAGANGAPVGINGNYVIPALAVNAGFTDVGGSFAVAGSDSLAFAGDFTVNGDFHAASSLALAGYTPIAGSAWIGGDVTNAGYATVGGNLYITGNDVLPLTVTGTRTKQTVSVAPPCDCNALLDVGALVDAAQVTNDNASIGLSPDALHDVIGVADVTLPCGKYFLNDISGIGQIVIRVGGRVALFIEGSITAAADLEVQLSPSAEIDVFIKGTLVLAGKGSFGSTSRPAATRIYVGGSDDVVLVGASGFVGNLYAPYARVTSVGYAKVWGSIFANDFQVPGYADISYDRAITQAGQGCSAPPPTSCSQCGTCTGGLACVGGTCGACTSDSDCCGQDVCESGACQVLNIK
jgi:hypothetical protein